MGFLRRWRPVLILVPVMGILAWAAVVFYSSLEVDRNAERDRQQRFMRNAAFAVVDELGSELFTMYSTFSYDLMARRGAGMTVDRDTLTEAIGRYRAQARFPELLDGLVCLSTGENDATVYSEWTGNGWIIDHRPDWALDLTPPLKNEALLTVSRPPSKVFSLDKPVLTLFLRGGPSKPGAVIAVALRFSEAVVLEQIVPTLVRQQFTEMGTAQAYAAQVRNRDLPGTPPPREADWETALLPTTSFDSWFEYYVNRIRNMDRSWSRPPGSQSEATGGWALTVTRLPGGLDQEMNELAVRNVCWALGFFLVLALGFLGLFSMATRALSRAREERTFLALISHELKTPLAVVRSLSENLAQGVGTTEVRAREYGEVLLEESDRLSRMVVNILALTAVQGGLNPRDLGPVDLGEVVRDRVGRQPPRADVAVEVLIHPGLPPVWAHSATLTAAVDNLVGNAFRHGLAGSGPHRIRIVVEPRVRWRRHGVELVVEDNGPGVPWDEGFRLFRPFHRGRRAESAQTPGSGVGLSLVRATAAAMGGHLSWRSRPGSGTRFCLWLREAQP